MAKRREKFRRTLILLIAVTAITCLIGAIDYRAYPYGAAISGPARNTGENGLWLRYTWYFGEHTSSDVLQLANHLRSRQIKYAYFHMRSVGNDGRLEHRYPEKSRTLTAGLHRKCPEVKLIAWVYADNEGKRGVHLSDPMIRDMMVSEAVWLVSTCGFDGVQWDVEPCTDNDSRFLTLLQETKAALPRGKLLCIASPIWQPAALRQFGWSDSYFSHVSKNCDQIAVMCYDSGFYMPRAYVWLVSQQAIHVTRAVNIGNPKCRVMLGVPTYGDGLPSHNPRAENLSNALRGVREGLADPGADIESFEGVAMFADYTTTSSDWNTYDRLWLSK